MPDEPSASNNKVDFKKIKTFFAALHTTFEVEFDAVTYDAITTRKGFH